MTSTDQVEGGWAFTVEISARQHNTWNVSLHKGEEKKGEEKEEEEAEAAETKADEGAEDLFKEMSPEDVHAWLGLARPLRR